MPRSWKSMALLAAIPAPLATAPPRPEESGSANAFVSFDARLFGAPELLKTVPTDDGLVISLSEDERTPIDTLIVLTPRIPDRDPKAPSR